MNMDIAQLITVLTQLGVAAAAWRLANKIDKRQEAHEKVDTQFHADVKAHLTMQDSTAREFQRSLVAKLSPA